tara:strand:- start:1820 stop:2041 length:222 start_codon:yes stop_codon:yes gene_type:complete
MNSLFKLKNLIRCCPNCVCATKIEKNVLQIPLNPKEEKRFEQEYKDLTQVQMQCDLYKTHLMKEFLKLYTKDT